MKKVVTVFALALALSAPSALADDKPSSEEMAKMEETAKAWGCSGGQGEKESEGTGVLELNDVKCADGANYDIKMNSDYKVISITAD